MIYSIVIIHGPLNDFDSFESVLNLFRIIYYYIYTPVTILYYATDYGNFLIWIISMVYR